MKTWDELILEVQETKNGSASRKSENKSLVRIFSQAKKWGLSQEITRETSISNFREIIKEANFAIKDHNKSRLEELFIMAAQLTAVDLRLALGKSKQIKIKVEVTYEDDEPVFHLHLREDQYQRIVSSTRMYFQFEKPI